MKKNERKKERKTDRQTEGKTERNKERKKEKKKENRNQSSYPPASIYERTFTTITKIVPITCDVKGVLTTGRQGTVTIRHEAREHRATWSCVFWHWQS